MLLWVVVVYSFVLLNNMPSKPEMLSHVKLFFLFPSLPHRCQFYFLHLSHIYSLLSLWAKVISVASRLVTLSSCLAPLQVTQCQNSSPASPLWGPGHTHVVGLVTP